MHCNFECRMQSQWSSGCVWQVGMCLTIHDVSDHVHMPRDSPANTACEANYGPLSAAHCADAVEGALNACSVVTAKISHCLLRCLQVFPSDLHGPRCVEHSDPT